MNLFEVDWYKFSLTIICKEADLHRGALGRAYDTLIDLYFKPSIMGKIL